VPDQVSRRTDWWIRAAAVTSVLGVAGFAAAVSYSHIRNFAEQNGTTHDDAQMLPLSVDGLIVAGSLVMLHEARAGRPAPPLARCMLWLGIGATVAANIAYGIHFGWKGAVVSAWPAVAFIGSAEMIMSLFRRYGRARAAVVRQVRVLVWRRLWLWAARWVSQKVLRRPAPAPEPDPPAVPIPPVRPVAPRRPVPVPAQRSRIGEEAIEEARAELVRAAGNGGLPSARALARTYLATESSPNGDRRIAGRLIEEALAGSRSN
jgi:hypothetical protein